jgi:hypothetical protein
MFVVHINKFARMHVYCLRSIVSDGRHFDNEQVSD